MGKKPLDKIADEDVQQLIRVACHGGAGLVMFDHLNIVKT